MRVLLRSDVEGVGHRGDLVEVAKGYARNFLVPKGLAVEATDGMERQAASMRRARDQRDAVDRGAAEDIARRLVPEVITVTAKAGEAGKLFGSVTTSDVTDAVVAQTGIELDRKALSIDTAIKEIGQHHVSAKLHADVEFQITIEVVSD